MAGGLTAAWLLGIVSHKLRLSPIVGYLLAGVAVGPFTPGFVGDKAIAEQFAELGVILLMFGVGLHFHLKDLLAVRRFAIPGAVAQIAAATALGVVLAFAAGWTGTAGVVYGLAIAVASTVVLLRVLADANALHTPAGHVAVGWLLVEDLFTVVVLVLLPILAGSGAAGGAGGVAQALIFGLAKLVALIGITFVVGGRVIPGLLRWVDRRQSRELFTLTVLVIAVGIAVGAAEFFGASMALGAFLAGMIVGQSEFSARAASDALPMRDAFAVLFFVAMGMLLDPMRVGEHAALIAATLAIVLIGKPLVALLAVLLLRGPLHTAVAVSVALAQIGEFSFIVAALGTDLDLLPEAATQALVATAIVSITLNPLLYRATPAMERGLARLLGRPMMAPESFAAPRPQAGAHRAIVVGYGPVGRSVTRLLREQEIEPTVIERSPAVVARLQGEGIRAVCGDAGDPDVLREAGIAEAGSLLFTFSGAPPKDVIRAAMALNPTLAVVVRSAYVSQAPPLLDAGADLVIAAEAEVAIALTEHILVRLGATRDQIDRAREAVRSELEPRG
ncbi:MAG: cation:proton antiporter [Myxococcota bacterium]